MADNIDNGAGNATGTMQGNGNPPENMIFPPPGYVYPYSLSEDGVEEPFEPISWFAMRESGGSRQFGPLNEEELKTFLRHKLDRRNVCSRDVIENYTNDVAGLEIQLTNLRNRINQIKDTEKERTNKFKKRISEIEKALRECKPLPDYTPYVLSPSKAAREAFQHIGPQGPLGEIQLYQFINTGTYDRQIPTNELIKQLKDLRLRINDNLDIENHKLKLPYERVVKALNDILTEMAVLTPRRRGQN